MKFTLALVLFLLLLVGAGAGVWLLMSREVTPLPQDDGPRVSAGQATEELGAEQPITLPGSERAPVAVLGDALARFGLEGRSASSGFALVTGRVVSPDTASEGAEFGPVPATVIAVHAVGSDGGMDVLAAQTVNVREDGYFLLTVPSSGAHVLAVTAENFDGAQVSVSRDDLEDGGHVTADIVLLKSAVVTVSVTSGIETLHQEVTPVADLYVVVTDPEGKELAKGRTSDAGKVSFEAMPRGRVSVKAHRTPLQAINVEVVVDRPEVRVDLSVNRVGTLEVRAKSATGALLKNFAIALDIHRDRDAWLDPRFVAVEAGSAGYAVVTDVVVGTWNLFATAKGLALGRLEDVEIKAGEITTVEVTLPLGFSVSGTVLSSADGQPISGAIVFSERDFIPASVSTHTGDDFAPPARATRTDARGRFTLDDLSAGSHDLSAIHREYAAGRVDGIDVGPNVSRASDPIIRLGVGAELTGHCFGEDGQPREAIQVMVIAMMDRNVDRKIPLIGVTDAEGFYHITRVTPGASGVLKIDAAAMPPSEFKMTLFRAGEKKVMNFGESRSGATLVGHVTDGAGAPAGNVGVMVVGTPSGSGGLPPIYQSASDSEGAFRIMGIPEGTYQLHVSLGNVGGNFAGIGTVTLPESGEVVRDIELPEARISGRVLSKEDRKPPRIGEVILLRSGGEFAGRCALNRDGSYAFGAVMDGEYLVAASAQDHQSETSAGITVRSGREVSVPDILLAAGGRLSGFVYDASNKPVAGAGIVLIDPVTQAAVPAWSLGSTAEGAFEVQSVPVGSYLVNAVKAGLTFVPTAIEVKAGAATTVILRAQ